MRATVVLLVLLTVGGAFSSAGADGSFAGSAWSSFEAPPEVHEPVSIALPAAPDPGDPADGCRIDGDEAPTGRLANGHFTADAALVVEVEAGLALDPDCVADLVANVLGFDTAVTVTIASSGMLARLCAPLDTTGITTCWNGSRAVVDAGRWESATAEERADLLETQVRAALGL